MTHHDNLAAVRAACIAASGKNPTEGCICSPVVVCASHAALERFDPTLPDVLLALGKFGKPGYNGQVWYAVDDRGWLLGIDGNGLLAQQHPKMVNLDLRASLSGWSEEAVAALANLLKKDD